MKQTKFHIAFTVVFFLILMPLVYAESIFDDSITDGHTSSTAPSMFRDQIQPDEAKNSTFYDDRNPNHISENILDDVTKARAKKRRRKETREDRLLDQAVANAQSKVTTKYEYNGVTSEHYLDVESASGDVSMRVMMNVKWRTWTIMGEPVISCWHQWKSTLSEIKVLIEDGRETYYAFYAWSDLPERVRERTRVEADAYIINTGYNSRDRGIKGAARFLCQHGVDRGIGKRSLNFPASPNWDRFIWLYPYSNDLSGTHYRTMTDAYLDAKKSYVSTAEAKQIYKNRSRMEGQHTFSVAGLSLNGFYIKKWAMEQVSLNKKNAPGKQSDTGSWNGIDNMFSDVVSQKDRDNYEQLLSKQQDKLRLLKKHKQDLVQVQKGLLNASKKSSDARARYIALLKPKYNLKAFVASNGKYGYKNQFGTIIIPAKYLSAGKFNKGIATVASREWTDKQRAYLCGVWTYEKVYVTEYQKINTQGSFIGTPWNKKFSDITLCAVPYR